ncbi:response regulator transcription factor [Salipiger sp. PrR003]|uniref:response regulator transcription factor n=1 Tax=Salipiger sp. PrR003 TaxID=2706776 RepID=UPI0013DA08DC|nr:response regulator [Salipiger sp. PrR003]NDV51331.1 response regulator [Salipiger sp. PrR003]
MEPKPRIVLIVEDDAAVSRALSRAVRSLGFSVYAFESGEALLASALPRSSAVLLLDLHLPGIGGAELISALAADAPDLRIAVMTGRDVAGAREACLEAGAACYITKPIPRSDLAALLDS